VSSTHPFNGRLSRRSDICSMDEWLGWMGATSSLDCEGCLCFADLFDLATGACLGPTVTLGADFEVLFFFLVAVTSFRGFSVTRSGVGVGAGGVVAFTTRPPQTTWFQPGPSFSCSADSSAHFAWTVEGLGVPHILLRSTGARLASAALASPLCTAPVVGCVVSSADAALVLLLRGGALP